VLNLNPVAASSEPWWRKYTEQAVPTDVELAFLEMKSFYSFTDLLTGNVSLHKLVVGASPTGGWRSCDEESAMALQPTGNGSNLL
jgi:hypothetical protein